MNKGKQWDDIHAGNIGYWQISDVLLIKILQKIGKVERVLDVGCGKGELVLRLRKRGYKAEGVDISLVALKSNRKLFDANVVRCLDIETDHIENYDLIFCNMVLGFVSHKSFVLSKLLAKANVLVISQVILLSGVAYSPHAMRIGIWEQEFNELLEELRAVDEIVFSEIDEFCALRQVHIIRRE